MSRAMGGERQGSRGEAWHAIGEEAVAAALDSPPEGLTEQEAADRLARFGANALPEPAPPGALTILARQFLSPLIYVLVGAAAVTAWLGEWIDTGVIFVVVVLNALIGMAQESGAKRAVR